MCTLTFVPAEDGYLAGMNRDELLTRPAALPPSISTQDGLQVIYPREPSGGTWIACNSHGNLLALLNWNDANACSPREKLKSRGMVIPELIGGADLHQVDAHFDRLALDGVFPFRLAGIFWRERIVREWRWNGVRTEKLEFPWARKHWFSSSLSDLSAEGNRGRVCEAAESDPAAGSMLWLRSLHRSHDPSPGPFSVCVHRQDAATVSYTEVRCRRSTVSMDYLAGSPCSKKGFDALASIPTAIPDSMVQSACTQIV